MKAGYTITLNKCPLSHLLFWVLLSWKLKPWKIWICVLFFHLLKEQAPTAIKKQSHNNYSYGVLFGLPVYGLNFVKVNTCFEDLFFVCVCVWTINHWNWQKLIWIIYVLSIVLSLLFFFCWSFKHAVVLKNVRNIWSMISP